MIRETVFNEVFDAQKHYRVLMDSMARPGKINTLNHKGLTPPVGLHEASAVVAFCLLNADVSFKSVGMNNDEVTRYLILNTSSSPTDMKEADFIFMNGSDFNKEMSSVKTGTLSYPEEGATLIIDVKQIKGVSGHGLSIVMKGPGIESEKVIFIEGLTEDLLDAVLEMNSEFPLGVDMILTDAEGNVVCMPRSCKFSWKNKSDL